MDERPLSAAATMGAGCDRAVETQREISQKCVATLCLFEAELDTRPYKSSAIRSDHRLIHAHLITNRPNIEHWKK
jgi:hypothetical protein